MARIDTLLLAVDLHPVSDFILDRVLNLYADVRDNIHIVHVIRNGMHDAAHLLSNFEKDPAMQRRADQYLQQLNALLLRHDLSLPADQVHLLYGEPACEIKRLADELDAELVIVGSRTSRSDWLQLPGTTTNCVIQGIKSDVMAVKVSEQMGDKLRERAGAKLHDRETEPRAAQSK